jgi:histidinol-phosphate aminotransferase
VSGFDAQKFLPEHLAGLKGYAARPPVPFSPGVLKLDLNECLAPPSPRVRQALQAAANDTTALNWYPDPTCRQLREAIGRYLKIAPQSVLVTNGSNMAMEAFARTFLSKGDHALIVSPVYDIFREQCCFQQARVEPFYFADPFAPDFNELLARPETPKVIYLANPNNPTGVGHRREDLDRLLHQRRDTLVVVDEAYNEFYGTSCVDLVERHPHLLVLRSFSKAFSLAGMRCGYVVAQPGVLALMQRLLAPWAVGALTQVAATAALEDLTAMRAFVAECATSRKLVVEGLRKLGFVARDTHANFVLWQVRNPSKVVQQLADRNVYVSNKATLPQMEGYLRVTVGLRAQADQFLEIVTELCAQFSD